MTLYDENFLAGDARYLVEPRNDMPVEPPHPWADVSWKDAYAYLGECLAASRHLQQIAQLGAAEPTRDQAADGHARSAQCPKR